MNDTRLPILKPVPLWFGMLGGPIVWSVHLLAIWLINEFGCVLSLGQRSVIGINAIHLLVLIASVIAGSIILVAGLVAYRNWRQIEAAQPEVYEEHARSLERGQFMALTGIAFNALFLLVLFYTTVPVFVIPACSVV